MKKKPTIAIDPIAAIEQLADQAAQVRPVWSTRRKPGTG